MHDKQITQAEKPTRSGAMRLFWLTLGWLLMIFSPVIGAIPGPGFILVFPIGLAIVLKNSLFAKRQYAKLARAFPEYGNWLNWALRRKRYKTAPAAPDLWGDIKHIFRRDDESQEYG